MNHTLGSRRNNTHQFYNRKLARVMQKLNNKIKIKIMENMGLQSSSMADIQMTSLVSMTCWVCLSLPLVMGPSSASWSLPLVVSSSIEL